MTDAEQLCEWFVHLSDMIGGELSEDSTLEEGLAWFGELSDETLSQIQNLGRDNPSIRAFLDLGAALQHRVLS